MAVAIFLIGCGCDSKTTRTTLSSIDPDKESRRQVEEQSQLSQIPTVHPILDEFQQSHERMLVTLIAVDKQAQQDHPFLGLRPLKMAELAVQTSGPGTPAWDRSVMHGIYGQQLSAMKMEVQEASTVGWTQAEALEPIRCEFTWDLVTTKRWTSWRCFGLRLAKASPSKISLQTNSSRLPKVVESYDL